MNPLALSVTAAARMVGVGRTMMYQLIRDKSVPIVKIGSRTVVRFKDLERFLQKQLTSP